MAPDAGLLVVASRDGGDALAALLRPAGLAYRGAFSVLEAREALRRGNPAAVVFDLSLPVAHAAGVCADLLLRTRAPVLVVYRGETQRQEALQLMRRGAEDLFPWDSPPEVAAARVELAIRRRR